MAKYQLIADIEVDTQELDVAYTEAERMISAGAAALGRPMPLLTVSARVEQAPATHTNYTITVQCANPKPHARLQLAFRPGPEGDRVRGALIAWEDNDPENAVHTYPLTATALQWLVRGLWGWPRDLLDDLARKEAIEERRSRGGAR